MLREVAQQVRRARRQLNNGCWLAGMSQREEEEVKWNAELEVALFHSMHGHKPVGEYVTVFVARE